MDKNLNKPQSPTRPQPTKAPTVTKTRVVVRPQGSGTRVQGTTARVQTPTKPQNNGTRIQTPVRPNVRPQNPVPPTTPRPQRPGQPQPIPKQKKKKFGVKKLIPLTLVGLAALGGGKVAYDYNEGVVEDNIAANERYEINKVKESLSYYGGDLRYVDAKPSDFFGIKKPYSYSYLETAENETIKVAYSSSITNHQKKMFKYTFDYLNSIFEVINPAVKFEILDSNTNDAQIYIKPAALAQNVGMNVTCEHDKHNKSQIEKATIRVNQNVEFTDTELKFYLLHEMMHVLTGSDDVNEHESETFSVYNYMDVGFINRQIENAWESEEEKQEAMNGHLVEVRPVLSKKEKEEFVTFLPTDLGTLIALYGDSDMQLNRENYVKLLNDTLERCQEVFGKNQPFFVPGYSIPQASVKPSDFQQSKDDDMSK